MLCGEPSLTAGPTGRIAPPPSHPTASPGCSRCTERCLKALAAVLFGLNVMLLAGCGSEVARTTSPSGKVEAVLVESSGGAATSFAYEVFVVPVGKSTLSHKKVASLYGAARSEQAFGVNLRWAGPANLTLEYLTAERQDLLLPNVLVAGEQVRVSLRSGVTDPKAPPGGMRYNLDGRPDDK